MEKLEIPVLDLRPEMDELWDELNEAIQGVLRSGQFIMGPNVKAFEEEVAQYLGVKHAVGLNSGTDALVIALRALGIGPGDEVITTPFTFFATAEAVSLVGATPVFVDIDPANFNLDVNSIEAAISTRTKVILPVHLYGCPADMGPILEVAADHGLKVLEDAAQAFGAEYQGRKAGAMGIAGCFSFFPSKNLGACGDGGLLVTNDPNIAELASALRIHGSRHKYCNEMVGYNSRLDELQAAILRVKLKYVDVWNDLRRQAARVYQDGLGVCRNIVTPAMCEGHVFHQYTIRVKGNRRGKVREALEADGIDSMVYYPHALHQLPVYSSAQVNLPEAERAVSEALSLPIWPSIERPKQLTVIRCVVEALAE